jgi:hypothetical protein
MIGYGAFRPPPDDDHPLWTRRPELRDLAHVGAVLECGWRWTA